MEEYMNELVDPPEGEVPQPDPDSSTNTPHPGHLGDEVQDTGDEQPAEGE